MKAWLRLMTWDDGTQHLGSVWSTEPEPIAGWRVVEIEIPDPPHEWKVGDWFINREGDGKQCRIVDIVGDEFSYAFRDWDGCPRADWSGTWMLEEECDPCDPPEWWEGDR